NGAAYDGALHEAPDRPFRVTVAPRVDGATFWLRPAAAEGFDAQHQREEDNGTRFPPTAQPLARHDGLRAGRWTRQPADGADRQAREARGLFRRQVAHHRFRAVER